MTNPAQSNKDSEIEKLFAPEEQALIKEYYSAGVSFERTKMAWEASDRICTDLNISPVEHHDRPETKEWKRTKLLHVTAVRKFVDIQAQVKAKTWDKPHDIFFKDNGLSF